MYRNIDAYDEKKASVSTWIYSITRNTVIDYFRTAKKTIHFDIESINDYSFSPHINTDIVLEELACALAKLDIRQRDLIILHYYDGKTFKEIATVFGISYIYTKVLHKKAVQNIKNLMIH